MSEEKTPEFLCNDCGEGCGENAKLERNREEHYETQGGNTLCPECYEENYFTCECCHYLEHNDYSHMSPNDEMYCESCMSETFTWCTECDTTIWYDDSYSNDDGYFCECCWENHNVEDSTHFVDDSPDSPRVECNNSDTFENMPVSRMVGIEAECVFGDCDTDDDGTPMALHNPPSGWRSTYDGSISGNGREMISKPANGDILHHRILALEDWAKFYDVYVNRSCGLHVHFDATDTSWEDLRGIAIVMHKVEQHLFKMLPPSRTNSNWCRKVSMPFKRLVQCSSQSEFVQLWYDGYYINRDKYNDSRYHGLNLHARFYLGTIEFRYHSATLNYNKISNWIKLCNSVIETGLQLSRNDKFKHRTFYLKTKDAPIERSPNVKLGDLLCRMKHLDRNVVKYMMSRMGKFQPQDEIFTDVSHMLDLSKIK